MAYYQYYQNGGPWQSAWGTNAYQFQAPPMPSYVPQPSWQPVDYYRAHSGMQDSSVFDYVWSKVRGALEGSYASRGEAEHWHRRIYSGLVDVSQLMPREIGAAAGWETIRLWQSHSSIYRSPLSGESEREREAIMGLAIAEATRLWQYVGRPLDKYGRREACEVAAATAGRTYVQLYGYNDAYEPYHGNRMFSGSDYGDDSRTLGRRRSFNNIGGSSYGSVSPYSGPMQIPVAGSGSVYGGSSYGGAYGGASPVLGGGVAYGGASPTLGGGVAYGGVSPAYGGGVPYQQPYGPGAYGNTLSASPYQGNLLTPQSPTVIVRSGSSSGHHHRHRSHSRSGSGHHHHHRHRSRSNSRAYDY